MKKIFAIVFAALLMANVSNAMERNPWFVSAGAGMNLCMENAFHSLEYSESVYGGGTFGMDVTIGRWMNDYWALAIGYNGYKVRNDLANDAGVFPAGDQPFHYTSVQVLWDFCNTVAGINPNRVVSFVPYLSVGTVFGTGAFFGAGVGLSMPIKISEVFSIVPDMHFIGTSDHLYGDKNRGIFGNCGANIDFRFSF